MSERLPLACIRLDGSTQPREYVNADVVADYANAMGEGATFPPVGVFCDGTDYWLWDGFHRVQAASDLGWESIAADVRPGTLRDATLAAAGANILHGLRRTNQDKRRAVLALLRDEEWSKWSDAEIARRCGVSHPFVGKVRAEHSALQSCNGYSLDDETIASDDELPSSPPPLYGWHQPPPPTPTPTNGTNSEPPRALVSSASREWYTPLDYCQAAHEVMGGIDLDPASSALANERVGAARFLTQHDDGMTHDWPGRVFLNPPYGRERGEDESNQERWSHRLIDQHRRGITTEAILLVNATPSNQWWAPLWDFPVCFTNHRIRFWGPDRETSAPTHSNAFVYLGSNVDAFDRVFSQFGVVVVRRTDWSKDVSSTRLRDKQAAGRAI